MFKKINFLVILFLLVSFNNLAFSASSILFIDLDYIYSNSDAGKKINNSIQKEAKKISTDSEKFKKKIEEEKKKLINQKNILAKEEYEKKVFDLEKKVNQYNSNMRNKRDALIKFSDKAKIKFSNELKDILQDYAVKKEVEMIINKNNILVGKNKLDATKDILDLFNKNVKILEIK